MEFVLRVVLGLASAGRLARRAGAETPANNDLDVLTEALGIRQRVTMVESDATATPIACGLFRPRVVMPREAAHWSEERRHVALLHELAHIKRRDCLTQLLAQLVCASPGAVRRMVLSQGMRLAGAGALIGLVAALALGRAIVALLYGVSPFDPVTLVATLAVFLAVAVLASL